jgi:plastocyanin
MTSLLRICFSAAAIGACVVTCAQAQSTVTGSVLLTDANRVSVHRKRDYSDVAVWLEPVNDPPVQLAVHKRAMMLQKDKRFLPHLLVVESGTSIDFPNEDPIFHNAFSNFDGQLFDIGLYPPGTSRAVKFDRPGIVRVFCNIHSTMSAVIVVVNSPYFTTTMEDGSYTIHKVAPGSYRLHFFHERALPETLDRLTRNVTVTGETNQLEPVSISEAGYLPASHKNKYGKDYPVNPISPTYGVGDR